MKKRIRSNHVSIKNKEERRKRNKILFDWILSIYKITGKMPTLEEIASSNPVSSPVSKERARQVLNQLVEEGYLIKNSRRKWRMTYVINPLYIKREKR